MLNGIVISIERGKMEEKVEIKEMQKGDILILQIKGRLDAISSQFAEKKIFDCITSGKNKLLLNFTDVDYLSSAGMRLLLRTTKKLKTVSGKLVVCSVTSNVMDVLKMSGFDHVIELSKTEEDALAMF